MKVLAPGVRVQYLALAPTLGRRPGNAVISGGSTPSLRRSFKRATAVIFLSMLLAVPVPSHAQVTQTESISGLVYLDERPPGRLAPTIDLELRYANRPGEPMRTVVSGEGEYRFGGLWPGVYIITASAPGYRSVTVEIELARGSRPRRNTKLVLQSEAAPPGPRPGGIVSQNALQAPREARRRMEQAEKAFLDGQTDTAARLVAEALAAYPGYARALYLRGRVLERQGRPESAARSYEEAISRDPDLYLAYSAAAELYRVLADNGSLRRISELWKKAQPLESAPYYYSALARYESGEYRPALEDVTAAYNLPHSNLPHINLLMANCYLKLKNPRAAAERLLEFLATQPDDPLAEQARRTLSEIDRILSP
ncbi:MAG: tetratricopeptide repeat protein [Acidobacteria bacterium]|nr:tetratricopeptide repeat protein [Acidobacteriota bacterium]